MTGETGGYRWTGTRVAFWLSVVGLVVLQQYPGFWKSEFLVAGFMPAPLFYQVIVSLLAVVLWWIGTRVAWPDDTDSKVDVLTPASEDTP